MRNSTSFRTALIAAYKATPKRVYDFSEDPAGEYVWLSAAREYTEKYPLSLSQVPLETSDDVLTIAKTICNQFKTLVEDNGLSKLLYNSNGTPKHESAAQLLFMVLPIHIVTRITLILQKKETTGEVLSILNYRGEQLIKSLSKQN